MTISATFQIPYYQFLNSQSQIINELPDFAKDPANLIPIYRNMVLTRIFDAKAVALQRTGKLGTFAASLGQEAVATVIGQVMQKADVLCPSYREQGALLQRGIKISELLAFWGGDERGSNYTTNKEDFPICIPIGTQTLHAVGVAYAFKYRKQARVAVSVCGDGATSQGDFYEAMNCAGSWKLPVIFVVNNNQWAISVPRNIQTSAVTLAQKAIACGFSGMQVDGNDIIALRYTLEMALQKARAGEGPSLIEAITYRLCDHTTADHANRYRSAEEVTEAWQHEPIKRLRTYLELLGAWTLDNEEQLLNECTTIVEQAVHEYLHRQPQPPEAMFDYHYATLPHDLREQREIAKTLDERIFHE